MQEQIILSSQDGLEPIPEVVICERVLGKQSGHVKSLGWNPKPNLVKDSVSSSQFKEDVGNKYEKLEAMVMTLQEENAMLRSQFSSFQDQLAEMARQLGAQQRQGDGPAND